MRGRPLRLLTAVTAVAVLAAGAVVSASGGTAKRSRDLAAVLGVLRRPQTQADLSIGPLQRYAVLSFPGNPYTPVKSLIRLVASPSGASKVFLVPMRRLRTDGNGNLKLALIAAGGTCCGSAAAILAHGEWISGNGPESLVVVVPDGVAKVTALIGRPPTSKYTYASATVHNNVAVFMRAPTAIENPTTLAWYGPTGNIFKRIK